MAASEPASVRLSVGEYERFSCETHYSKTYRLVQLDHGGGAPAGETIRVLEEALEQ